MNLEHIYNLCTQLQQISSTKEKEKFLVDNRCEDFDKFLQWILDPQIVTGIDRKKLKKPMSEDNMAYVYSFEDFGEVLDWLKVYNTGRDFDVAVCQKCIWLQDEIYYGFLEDVFTKKLKLGVTSKTLNKVYGKNFIYRHEVQLGSSLDKLRLKDGEYFYMTRKLNGVRCTYVDDKLISRQGTVFNGLDHIFKTLKDVEKYISNEGFNQWVFDGELIHHNDGSLSDNDNFRLGTGIINSDSADKSDIKLVMFDVLPLEEFKNGKSKSNYGERRELLDKISIYLENQMAGVEVTPLLYHGDDKDKIQEWLNYADTHDWEGCMINLERPYVTKRTNYLIKVKTFKHSDLRIVDCLEGDGKYKGVLGAFVVQFKDNTVNVGSGFTDKQREDYWVNKDILIGKICQVKYKEVSKDKDTGLESLQFPVFEMLRDDKDSVSYE